MGILRRAAVLGGLFLANCGGAASDDSCVATIAGPPPAPSASVTTSSYLVSDDDPKAFFEIADDGLTWTQMDSPMLSNGGQLAWDPDHHLLYSSNGGEGMWRVVVQ